MILKYNTLDQLDLRNNNLQRLPAPLDLPNLVQLYLGGNPALHQDETWALLGQLPILRILGLHAMNLGQIPEPILNYGQLMALDLSDNPLPSLPVGLYQLTNLEVLNIAQTQLVTLPAVVNQLPQLKVLYVDACPGLSLSQTLERVAELPLEVLSARQLPLDKLPEALPTIRARELWVGDAETDLEVLDDLEGQLPYTQVSTNPTHQYGD